MQSKFIKEFHLWLNTLETYGYESFTEVLNAKDYGVPQNRDRVFCVSILRTQKTPNPTYYFQKPFPLERRLKDVLEDNVDEKYYLSDKMLDYFNRVDADKTHGHNFTPKDADDTAFAIRTAPDNPSDRKTPSNGQFRQRCEIGDDTSNTLTSVAKDNYVVEFYEDEGIEDTRQGDTSGEHR